MVAKLAAGAAARGLASLVGPYVKGKVDAALRPSVSPRISRAEAQTRTTASPEALRGQIRELADQALILESRRAEAVRRNSPNQNYYRGQIQVTRGLMASRQADLKKVLNELGEG